MSYNITMEQISTHISPLWETMESILKSSVTHIGNNSKKRVFFKNPVVIACGCTVEHKSKEKSFRSKKSKKSFKCTCGKNVKSNLMVKNFKCHDLIEIHENLENTNKIIDQILLSNNTKSFTSNKLEDVEIQLNNDIRNLKEFFANLYGEAYKNPHILFIHNNKDAGCGHTMDASHISQLESKCPICRQQFTKSITNNLIHNFRQSLSKHLKKILLSPKSKAVLNNLLYNLIVAVLTHKERIHLIKDVILSQYHNDKLCVRSTIEVIAEHTNSTLLPLLQEAKEKQKLLYNAITKALQVKDNTQFDTLYIIAKYFHALFKKVLTEQIVGEKLYDELAEALQSQQNGVCNGLFLITELEVRQSSSGDLKILLAIAKNHEHLLDTIAQAILLQNEDKWNCLTIIMVQLPDVLEQLLSLMEISESLHDTIVKTLPLQCHEGWNSLQIMARYNSGALLKLISLLTNNENFYPKIAQALLLQNTHKVNSVHLMARHSPDALEKLIENDRENLLTTLIIDSLPVKSNEYSFVLHTMARYAPKALARLILKIGVDQKFYIKIKEMLPLHEDDKWTSLHLMALYAQNALNILIENDKEHILVETIATTLPLKNIDKWSCLHCLASSSSETLEKLIEVYDSNILLIAITSCLPLKNHQKTTCLHLMAEFSPNALLQLVMKYKNNKTFCNIVATLLPLYDKRNLMCLHTMTQHSPEILEELIESNNKAILNSIINSLHAMNYQKSTLLHLMAEFSPKALLQLVLKFKNNETFYNIVAKSLPLQNANNWTCLHTIGFRSPEILEKLVDSNNAELLDAIATALPIQDDAQKWTVLQIITEYTPKSFLEIISKIKNKKLFYDKIAEALPLKNTGGLTGLHTITINKTLEKLIESDENDTLMSTMLDCLPLKSKDSWTNLQTIAQYSPGILLKLVSKFKNRKDFYAKTSKILLLRNKMNHSCLFTIAKFAPEALKSMVENDKEHVIINQIAEILPLQVDHGLTYLHLITIKTPKTLNILIENIQNKTLLDAMLTSLSLKTNLGISCLMTMIQYCPDALLKLISQPKTSKKLQQIIIENLPTKAVNNWTILHTAIFYSIDILLEMAELSQKNEKLYLAIMDHTLAPYKINTSAISATSLHKPDTAKKMASIIKIDIDIFGMILKILFVGNSQLQPSIKPNNLLRSEIKFFKNIKNMHIEELIEQKQYSAEKQHEFDKKYGLVPCSAHIKTL